MELNMRKRRSWSDAEKRSICLETLEDGVSVAAVAQRYGMNSNLIFKWLRDPRYAPTVPSEYDGTFVDDWEYVAGSGDIGSM